MSVCIKVTPQYRLTTDPLQWLLQKYIGKRPDGRERWDAVGYYVSPKHAINGLYNILLRECDATSLVQLKETGESLVTTLLPAYARALEVSADITEKRKQLVLVSLEKSQKGIGELLK